MLYTVGAPIAATIFAIYLWDIIAPIDLVVTGPLTPNIPVTLRRGMRQVIFSAPVRPHFHLHPFASFEQQNNVFFEVALRLVHNTSFQIIRSIESAANLVSFVCKLQNLFLRSRIEDYITFLRARLGHGTAQLSTIQIVFTSATAVHGIIYRCLCPASFLLGLLVGLAPTSSVLTGAAVWLFSGGLLLLVFVGCRCIDFGVGE